MTTSGTGLGGGRGWLEGDVATGRALACAVPLELVPLVVPLKLVALVVPLKLVPLEAVAEVALLELGGVEVPGEDGRVEGASDFVAGAGAPAALARLVEVL